MRTYNVGVPAWIEVDGDGSVIVTVELADLDDLYETENDYPDAEVEADQRTVGAALAEYRTNGTGYATAVIKLPAPRVGN